MKPLFTLTLACAAITSQAHFIWITIDSSGHTADLQLSESPGKGAVPMLYKIQSRFTLTGLSNIKDSSDHMNMAAQTTLKSHIGAVEVLLGLHGTSLVHFSAKGALDRKSAMKPIGLSSEILLRKSGAGWKALITKNGKSVSGADVEIHMHNRPEIDVKSDANGYVALRNSNGPLAIGAFIHEPTRGKANGVDFTEKLEACSLVVSR